MTTWDCPPNRSRWCGMVICEPRDGGDVDYFYGYSDAESRPNARTLVPLGWRLLSSSVKMTPGHPRFRPSRSAADTE